MPVSAASGALQRVGSQRYFDTAGFPGRTLGFDVKAVKQKTAFGNQAAG